MDIDRLVHGQRPHELCPVHAAGGTGHSTVTCKTHSICRRQASWAALTAKVKRLEHKQGLYELKIHPLLIRSGSQALKQASWVDQKRSGMSPDKSCCRRGTLTVYNNRFVHGQRLHELWRDTQQVHNQAPSDLAAVDGPGRPGFAQASVVICSTHSLVSKEVAGT